MQARIAAALCLALTLSTFAQEKPAEPPKPAQPLTKPAEAPKVAEPAKPEPAKTGLLGKATTGGDAPAATGFFFEGYGLFTLSVAGQTSVGSTKALADGTVSTTSTTYKSAGTMGFGGGGAFGYFFYNNLALMLSFDYRYSKSRKWTTTVGSTSTDTQDKYATSWIGLGLRPRLVVGPGAIYAGAGVAFLLPHVDTVVVSSGGTTTTTETEWNYAFGAYAEFGYQMDITEGIYMGLGTRLFMAGPDNKGGTTETGSVQINNTDTVASTLDTAFATRNITDISVTLILGLRL